MARRTHHRHRPSDGLGRVPRPAPGAHILNGCLVARGCQRPRVRFGPRRHPPTAAAVRRRTLRASMLRTRAYSRSIPFTVSTSALGACLLLRSRRRHVRPATGQFSSATSSLCLRQCRGRPHRQMCWAFAILVVGDHQRPRRGIGAARRARRCLSMRRRSSMTPSSPISGPADLDLRPDVRSSCWDAARTPYPNRFKSGNRNDMSDSDSRGRG